MLSRSGETCSPSSSMSSATLPTMQTLPGSTTARSPRRNRAPPTPPERTATFTPPAGGRGSRARGSCSSRPGQTRAEGRRGCRRRRRGSVRRRAEWGRAPRTARRCAGRRRARTGRRPRAPTRSWFRRPRARSRVRRPAPRPRAQAGRAPSRTAGRRSRRGTGREAHERRPRRVRRAPPRPAHRPDRRRTSPRRGSTPTAAPPRRRVRTRPRTPRRRRRRASQLRACGAHRREGRGAASGRCRGRGRRRSPYLEDTTGVVPPENVTIAERLDTLAALLDLAGAGYYSVRAYRRAAELIRASPAPVAELVRQGRVRELRGIGASIESRLQELVETGTLREIEELQAEVRPELVGLARLAGMSPQRMVELARVLGVTSADELREAAAAGRLRDVPGVGPATEARERAALERPATVPRRGLLLSRAWQLVEAIAAALGGVPAGDPRRWCDTSHRLAVVVAEEEADDVLTRFAELPEVVALVERGPNRAVGVTVDGVPVEVVVAPPARFGTELLRATGSDAYVGALGELPAGPDEETVYALLGLPYLPPELREAPAPVGSPPPLVELGDVRGDLHVHTVWSDGKATVLEMAEAAAA